MHGGAEVTAPGRPLTTKCHLWFTPGMSRHNPFAHELLNFVGQSRVARTLGVSRQAVSKWRLHGIPPDRAGAFADSFPGIDWTVWIKAIGRGRGR